MFACPPGRQAAFANRLTQPANNNPIGGYIQGPLLVQVIDLIDVSTSRQSQLEKLEGDHGRRPMAAEDVQNEDEDTTRNSKKQKTWRLTVRDAAGTEAFLIYTRPLPTTIEPRLGALIELKAGTETHRGIIVAEPAQVSVLEEGWYPTREQWLWRLRNNDNAEPA